MTDSRAPYAIVGIVVIASVAGAAYLVLGDDDGGNDFVDDSVSIPVDFEFNSDIRLAIFGNANGDDYLDQDDVDLLSDLLNGRVEYDSKKHAYADTDGDGKLTSGDLENLKRLVSRGPGKLHYYSAASEIASIDYPLKAPFCTHHVYPLDACIILGIYDDVIGMSNQGFRNSVGKDSARYPGIGTKITDVGTPYEDPQAFLQTGAKTLLAPWNNDYSSLEKLVSSTGIDVQVVKLPMSSNSPNYVDQYASILMLGVMVQKEGAAHEYIDFIDGIQDYISSKQSQITKDSTFITPMITTDKTEVGLDTKHHNGSMHGDVYTLSRLPMESVNLVCESGCPKVSMEWVYTTNPDVIVIIMFHDSTHSKEDIQKAFDEGAEIYKNTSAYKNNMVFGVNYYNIANYCGIPQLPILANFIWGDVFDERTGWNYLQEYFDKYTLYADTSLDALGSSIPYRMSKANS